MNEIATKSVPAPRRLRLPAIAKRHPGAAGLILLLAFTTLIRLGWGWQAERQLQVRLDGLRRQGQPVTSADVRFESVPDDRNAWPLIVKAGSTINVKNCSPRNGSSEFPSYPPYGKEWELQATTSEQDYAPEIATARRVRALSRAQARTQAGSLWTNFAPGLNQARALGNTVADAAEYAHLKGNDSEAVERMIDELHLGRLLRQDPTLISQLVGIGFDNLACSAIQPCAPTLRIDDGKPGTASSQQVRSLIATLLDDQELIDQFRNSIPTDRALVIDYYRSAADGHWAIGPLGTRAAVRALNDYVVNVEMAAQDDNVSAQRIATAYTGWSRIYFKGSPLSFVTGQPRAKRVAPRYSRWFEASDNDMSRAVMMVHRVRGERRATAVLLALNLYRHDKGAWPTSLAELVPGYLPALPRDPFHDDGSPLGYELQRGGRSDGADRPLVYFEAGETKNVILDPEPMFSWQVEHVPSGNSHREVRQYRDASLWLPKVRRFDLEQEAQRKLDAGAVDRDPDKPDVPRQD